MIRKATKEDAQSLLRIYSYYVVKLLYIWIVILKEKVMEKLYMKL